MKVYPTESIHKIVTTAYFEDFASYLLPIHGTGLVQFFKQHKGGGDGKDIDRVIGKGILTFHGLARVRNRSRCRFYWPGALFF